jgi:hypothetical protein
VRRLKSIGNCGIIRASLRRLLLFKRAATHSEAAKPSQRGFSNRALESGRAPARSLRDLQSAGPVPPHLSPLPRGEGESSPAGRRIGGRWDLREPERRGSRCTKQSARSVPPPALSPEERGNPGGRGGDGSPSEKPTAHQWGRAVPAPTPCFARRSAPMRHQCDIKATSKRVASQAVATPKPPSCDPKATLKPP